MSNWGKKTLGEVARTFAGGTPSRDRPEFFGGNIPWISSGEVNQPVITDTIEKITEDGLKFSSAKRISKGAILIAMYGATAGQISKLLIDATANQAVLAVVPNADVSTDFIYYQLQISKEKILFFAQGSGQPNLSKSLVDSTVLNLPPLPHQRKIARILSTVDGLIGKTEGAIAKYQAIKQGMMHDLFTRGIGADGRLRPAYAEAPGLYRETAVGWVPREWEVTTISQVVKAESPVTYGIVQPGEYDPNGILLIRGQDYISGWVGREKFFRVNENLHKQFKRSTTVFGDILICIVGATTGAVQVVPEWIKEANITQTTARIRCEKSILIPDYVEYYLKSEFGKMMVKKYVKGSAQPGLNLSDVEKFIICFPRLQEEQGVIAKSIKSIDLKIQTEQTYLHKLHTLKQGLMQDLLTGRVAVLED